MLRQSASSRPKERHFAMYLLSISGKLQHISVRNTANWILKLVIHHRYFVLPNKTLSVWNISTFVLCEIAVFTSDTMDRRDPANRLDRRTFTWHRGKEREGERRRDRGQVRCAGTDKRRDRSLTGGQGLFDSEQKTLPACLSGFLPFLLTWQEEAWQTFILVVIQNSKFLEEGFGSRVSPVVPLGTGE
jgi:hypothetical protein